MRRCGYRPPYARTAEIIAEDADVSLFRVVVIDHNHVLRKHLPPERSSIYGLHKRLLGFFLQLKDVQNLFIAHCLRIIY